MRRLLLTLPFIASLIVLGASSPSASAQIRMQDLVTHWRNAVHARKQARALAVVVSESDEDGIAGNVEERVSAAADYRATTKRQFDETELVVTANSARLRDWNGFLRNLQGKELERLRTQIFEKKVLLFGPPSEIRNAVIEQSVVQSEDKKSYVLRLKPRGGAAMTWYIDATTSLPLKSVRPGDDSEITTTYEEWSDTGGIRTPVRARISETEKPDYQVRQISLRFENSVPAQTFDDPTPGPSDAVLQPDAPPIPFTMEMAHIVFKARLNGSAPIKFLLDTGADENVINSTRLADFGLKPYAKSESTGGGGSAEYDYASGATLTLPGVELRNQHVAVIDQTGLERALGIPLGGLLGYDFISRFVVEIDYEKKLLTLHNTKTWQYAGNGYIVPVTFDNGIPFTDGSISAGPKKDIPGYFVLDFGAQETITLTSPFVKANDLVNLAQTNGFVNRPAGLENQFFSQSNVRGHLDRLALGKMTEQSIPINMSVNTKGAYASANFSGTIGEGIFHRYHVFLDYTRNRIILEPTTETHTAFPERKTYGLTVLASEPDLHTYTVTAVRAGSQAEKDGFQKGDVITALNGKPASQFTLNELRNELTHEGENYEIAVIRANGQLTISAQVKLVSLDKA